MKPDLEILKDLFGIYHYENMSEVPERIESPDFYSFTKTIDEISIVCKQSAIKVSDKSIADIDWKIIKIKGPLSLSLTGIIAEITGVLWEIKVPVFTISTYKTDYILVKNENIDKAITALENNGYKILS
jgi:uncharacterized protein